MKILFNINAHITHTKSSILRTAKKIEHKIHPELQDYPLWFSFYSFMHIRHFNVILWPKRKTRVRWSIETRYQTQELFWEDTWKVSTGKYVMLTSEASKHGQTNNNDQKRSEPRTHIDAHWLRKDAYRHWSNDQMRDQRKALVCSPLLIKTWSSHKQMLPWNHTPRWC